MFLGSYLSRYVFQVKQNVNAKGFNMIIRINQEKTLVKHISCDCKCKFNNTACDSNQIQNNDKCKCDCIIR